MINAAQHIHEYFGLVGLLSIGAWVIAAILVLLFVLGWRRSKIAWIALGLAIVAFVFAKINSRQISEIKIDYAAEVAETLKRVERKPDSDQPDKEAAPKYSYRQGGKVD